MWISANCQVCATKSSRIPCWNQVENLEMRHSPNLQKNWNLRLKSLFHIGIDRSLWVVKSNLSRWLRCVGSYVYQNIIDIIYSINLHRLRRAPVCKAMGWILPGSYKKGLNKMPKRKCPSFRSKPRQSLRLNFSRFQNVSSHLWTRGFRALGSDCSADFVGSITNNTNAGASNRSFAVFGHNG